MHLEETPYLGKYGAFFAVAATAKSLHPSSETFACSMNSFAFRPARQLAVSRKFTGHGNQCKTPRYPLYLPCRMCRYYSGYESLDLLRDEVFEASPVRYEVAQPFLTRLRRDTWRKRP